MKAQIVVNVLVQKLLEILGMPIVKAQKYQKCAFRKRNS